MEKYVCERAIHPGEVLKEELEFRGITQKMLAAQIDMPYKVLNDIVNEHRSLTPTTALLFEAALGISSELLMRMQLAYNMRSIKEDTTFAMRLKKIREIAAVL